MVEGKAFKPGQKYTNRIHEILEGNSQFLREILQNSDDSQSTKQVFILDHNTYLGKNLLKPELSRFQGPALLSINNTKFNDDDFKSLENMNESEKRNQCDKIGEKGTGFNSIYYICDSCSFITDNKFTILDPHEWYIEGGIIYDVVELSQEHPDQVYPFKNLGKLIPFDGSFEGTIFRCPLRTERDSKDSKISNKIYKPSQILEMFEEFFENDSVDCLLFLRYIECIEFYELKEGKSEPELIYKILLKDAEKVREERQKIFKAITLIKKNLKENKSIQEVSLDTSYKASIVRYKNEDIVEDSSWLILNMLDNLFDTKKNVHNDFVERLGRVPNVGLATKLNLGQDENENNHHGKLFCFFPLQIDNPFRVSINGHFTVTNNRRDLWSRETNASSSDSEDNLKIKWNKFLFEEVIPQAWVKFIIKIQAYVNKKEAYYKFWPIADPTQFVSLEFFIDLLKNMIKKINQNDKIFWENDQMLSISMGYFSDGLYTRHDIPKILCKTGFPVINAPSEIIEILKKSDKHFLQYYSPRIVSKFLQEHEKWKDELERNEIWELIDYLFNDEDNEILKDLEMIPLANGTFKRRSQFGTVTYLCSDHQDEDDPREIFKDQLEKFIAKDIPLDLLNRLSDKVKKGWNFNIEMLTIQSIAEMVKNKIYRNKNHLNSNDEIVMDNLEWINRVWCYLCNKFNENDETDLKIFEDIHLIPTKYYALRKLKTNQIKYFFNSVENLQDHFAQIYPILEKLGIIFINREFENNIAPLRTRFSAYICDMSDITSVLTSLNRNGAYNLNTNEAELLIKYLFNYLRFSKFPTKYHIETIKCLPIFKEFGKNETTSLNLKENVTWLLLPTDEPKDYGQIIASKEFRFLDTTSEEARYLLKHIIKIRRLEPVEYWIDYVIKYLEFSPNEDIVIEKFFKQLPRLVFYREFDKDKVCNYSIVPCVTIQGKQAVDQIKRVRPVDLYDPSIPNIALFFFDDEQIFPEEKFWNRHKEPLKNLGVKTSLLLKDIVERIKTYIKRQKMGDNEVYDKSRNLLIYIDENWSSLQLDKNYEFLSLIKSQKWIPTIDKLGNKLFSLSSECRDKNDEHLVSLILPILDYRIVESQFRNLLEWNRPSVNIIIEQMMLCSKLAKENIKFKNQQEICKAVYRYIDVVLSCNNELPSKRAFKEISNELKNKKWIFCEGNFYAAENVVFNLSTDLVNELPIIKLPEDYQNNFINVFKHMGVRENIDISDFIKVIKKIAHDANNRALNNEELSKTIAILDQIGKEFNKSDNKKIDYLKDLPIPSTDAILFSLEEIKFDDRPGLNNDEKENYKLSHPKISLTLARGLGIRMLSEAYIEGCGIDFKIDEKSEFLKNCSLDSIFREFLQNADQAGARRISIYVDDERQWHKKPEQSTLLSKEMYNWQGPAIWIYNDAKIKLEDISSLINKSGIITSFNLTDVLSCVSGEEIAFLDPYARFLPILGKPPKRPRGIKLNFLNKKFLSRFEDQCKPYLAVEDCDFKKGFNGTLFRLPLRNTELSKQSSILKYLRDLKGNQILFLRSIETYNIYHIDKNERKQLIWEEKIQNLKEDVRDIRRKVDYKPQIFQLDTKIYDEQKKTTTFEVWLICTGGRQSTKEFSKNAHGGVAAILAQSDNEPLKKPLDLTDPPVLAGRNYAYVPCNDDYTKLNVHINGNFALSKDRKVISQQNNTHKGWSLFLQQNNHEKWNQYILLEVLPSLHVKLLDEIAKINYEQYEHFKNSKNIQPNNFVSCITKTTKGFWPFGEVMKGHLYYDYALNVLQNIGESKVFWTEANEGKFVSLDDAYFSEENDHTIANILAKHNISTVKVEKAILSQLKRLSENSAIKYQPIIPAFVYESLRANNNILKNVQDELISSHNNILNLLKFVLQDKNLYSQLIGLPMVPLKDGSFGKFGEQTYYMANKKDQDLFPKSGPSRFICDLDDELSKIFKSKDFSRIITNIKKLDAQGILDLLAGELCKEQEISWNPSSQDIPNRQWLDNILEKMEWGIGLEFAKLSEYPLLPVVSPSNKLVRADSLNPLLTYPVNPDEILVSALGKLGICFTDIKLESRNASSEFLKKSVFSWNDSNNVFESIKRKQTLQKISMESFFSNATLSKDELNKLREFVKDSVFSQQGNIEIIQELPIWPTRSEEHISAKEGKLLPCNLPCYSLDKDLYDVPDEYFRVLTFLCAKQYKEFDYVKQYYFTPDSKRAPTQEDVEFLEKILLLNDPEIMDYLKSFNSIPNRSLKSFVKADTLYNANEDLLFSRIFDDNRFLPSQLQNNHDCFHALLKMGLKQDFNNNNTYIECVRTIEFKINIGKYNDEEIRPIAKNLAEYFFDHQNINLNFKEDEFLNQLYKIKFVPSNKNLPNPYSKTVGQAGRTSGYESFGSLYSIKYQNICWTQAKFFASDVKHTEQPPNIEMVIDHWDYLFGRKIFQTSDWEIKTIYKIMEEIYKFVSDFLEKDEGKTTKLELKNLYFLNGDDPFNPDCWVLGNKLAFGIQDDIGSDLFKVNRRLEPFKNLLIAAGAKNTNHDINIPKLLIDHSQQKDKLIEHLIERLEEEDPDPQYHDVIFEIGNIKIGANRYVLSYVAKDFDWDFSANPIIINNIQPNTYKVLLRWLHGMPYSEAVEKIFGEEFSGQDYLDFLHDFLKASYKYQPLNDIIQNEIMDENKHLVNESNVKMLRDLSVECDANRLKKYCEEYIEKNQDIVDTVQKNKAQNIS